MDTLPDVLTDAPQFLVNNPIALQRKYLKLKDDPNTRNERTHLREAVKASKQDALEMLVDLFDWMDGLEPQSMKEIVSHYEHSQAIEAKVANILAQMNQAATMQAKIEEQQRKLQRASAVSFPLCLHPSFGSYAHWTKEMDAYSNKPLDTPVRKQQRVPNVTYLCNVTDCHSNCQTSRLFTPILRVLRLRCAKCNHSHHSHFHTRHVWVKTNDTQTSVDEDVKKEWEATKAEKEDTELLIAMHESELGDLTHAMGKAVDDLAGLAEDYAAISLSGPFSAHVEEAIRLLEQRCEDIEQKGISKERLRTVEDSLDLMKRKLELVTKAEEAEKAR